MKRTRLLVVSLISLLGISACGKGGDTPQPGDETVHVEKVELNKSAIKLQVGGQVTLTAKITPAEATVKNVTYSSDKPTIASVDEQGVVTAQAVGDAVITVTTQDGAKTASCQVQVLEHFENLEIDSLAAPGFVDTFKANTTRLDDVLTIQANPNPTKNSYYKNEEGGVDSYKVGSVNPFKFETTAVAFDEAEVESHINNPDTKVELFIKQTGEYTKVENLGTYVTVNANNNEFDFTEEANGEQFKLVISVNEAAYTSVSTTCKPVEFEFEVFDGYNVYSKEELSLFDNRTIHNLDCGHSEPDPWASFKANNPTLNQYKNEELKGMALHANMTLTSDDIPASMKVSEAEVDTYDASFPGSISEWIRRVNESDSNVQVTRDNLIDSFRDYQNVFYRVTNNSEFTFEGNYFTIDASRVKQVAFFDNSLNNGRLHFYGAKNETEPTDGSHAALFGFNCLEEGTDGATGVVRGGKEYLKNVTLIGNGKNVNSSLYLGGFIMYKVDASELNCQNVISSDTFITFLTRSNRDYLGKAEPLPASSSPEDIAAFEELQPGETSLVIDRYKSFDSYNSMFYVWGTRKNTITNSFMKGAGGPLFLLDEVNAHTKGKEASEGKTDAEKEMHGFTPRVDCTNVYMENWITATAPWFALKGATAAAEGIAQIGELGGPVGGGAAGVYTNPDVPAQYKTGLVTTTRVYDDPKLAGIEFFNLLCANVCAAAFDSNNATEGEGAPLQGQFNINNGIGDVFSMNLASFVPTSADIRDYTGEQIFRLAYMAAKYMGMVIKSQNGGAMMVGTDDAMVFNPDDGTAYPLQNTDAYKVMAGLLNNGFKEQIDGATAPGTFDYLYPNGLFRTDNTIGGVIKIEDGQPVMTGLQALLSAVSDCNYMTAYLKPAGGSVEFVGAVLGTVPLLESGLLPTA